MGAGLGYGLDSDRRTPLVNTAKQMWKWHARPHLNVSEFNGSPPKLLLRADLERKEGEEQKGTMSGLGEDNDGGRCGLVSIMNGVWRYHPQGRAL